jgi:hypothetical protein
MKNMTVFSIVCILIACCIAVGLRSAPGAAEPAKVTTDEKKENVPSVGRIQILNGCGVDGAANSVADFLRSKKFDVKNIGNAPSENYQNTLVVSRKKDMVIARQVGQALSTDAVILMRTQEDLYDVTVYVGKDYQELAR